MWRPSPEFVWVLSSGRIVGGLLLFVFFEEFRADCFCVRVPFSVLVVDLAGQCLKILQFLGENRAFRSVEQRGSRDVFSQQRAGVFDLTVSG